jgi:hypothetical protein
MPTALLLLGIWWLSVILLWVWPPHQAAPGHTDRQPAHRASRRVQAPTPFSGLTHKPCGVACEHAAHASAVQAPPMPLLPITSTRGRRRHVDTSAHFCPHPHGEYRGWVGSAISAPAVIRAVAPGGSGTVSSAVATASKPTARPCMASVCLPSGRYGQ